MATSRHGSIRKQLDDLSRQERKIELEQHEAQLAQKMEQQRLQNDWMATCNTFIERHAIYKDNPRLHKALDAEGDLAGKPETANWTGQRFDEAHKNLKAAFGFKDAAAPAPTACANCRPIWPRCQPPKWRTPMADSSQCWIDCPSQTRLPTRKPLAS